ncbi:7,8-dihydro-8-oxoguanine triphosphatase [Ignavibacterium album JCM 16511]|uniref:7,8-dihydro-8-oxoguanine triphosphatase n=1 Tax=Ignavibacterium album (strain DSM 19864 / JCM 16511 / NBRC 101810 / Mat9-16) TaxID=945713 RepID=I0AGK5_IGNAJ|nr:NUDIX domain-containing protein [Ignavibacterium album]AFH48112.1 7,8-dihydro-8-oxoguanine triphosphatase [Ignavibacterium album JCM 16511]
MNFGAGIILINSNNEVLLLLRDNKPEIPYPNQWDIPGGKIEDGETPDVTIKREMFEELGLESLSGFQLFKIYKSDELTDFVFWKRINLNPDEIVLTEGQKLKYFSYDEIKKTKLAFNYNKVIEEFFEEIIKNE